jgi:hypothetical protein
MEIGDLALGQGHDGDAGKAQALVESRHVFLVAREGVERLGTTTSNAPPRASSISFW